MPQNSRAFEAVDPFGRVWNVEFRWLQNGISIRHADTVDLKYYLTGPDVKREIVIALPHADLVQAARRLGRELKDAWCLHLASRHLERMIRTWEDMDKTIVTLPARELDNLAEAYEADLRRTRDEAALHH